MAPPPRGFVLFFRCCVRGSAVDAWWRQVFRCVKGGGAWLVKRVRFDLAGLDAMVRLPSVSILGALI